MIGVSSRKLTLKSRHQPTCREQPRLASQAASGHTTSVWQIRGPPLCLVALSEAAIHHQSSPPLSFAVLRMYVCAVCARLAHATKNEHMGLW